MDEAQLLGYAVTTLITLGGFIGLIVKFIQPINELRVVIQKLNDNIDSIKNDNTQQGKRIDKHDEQISELDHRVGTVETKMKMYHKEG